MRARLPEPRRTIRFATVNLISFFIYFIFQSKNKILFTKHIYILFLKIKNKNMFDFYFLFLKIKNRKWLPNIFLFYIFKNKK